MACLRMSLPFTFQYPCGYILGMLHSHYFDNSYCSHFMSHYRQQYLTCGSIMSGQRSELERIVAFSVDILSLGSPSLFHTAIWASSVSRDSGSSPSVMGTGGWNNCLSSQSSMHPLKLLHPTITKDVIRVRSSVPHGIISDYTFNLIPLWYSPLQKACTSFLLKYSL